MVAYQHTDLVEGRLVITDVASGQTKMAGDWSAVTVDDVRARLGEATTAAIAAVGPSSTVKSAEVDGTDAFVIETPGATNTNRTYIDKSNYHTLRSEQVAPDGHVTEYTMLTAVQVLPVP